MITSTPKMLWSAFQNPLRFQIGPFLLRVCIWAEIHIPWCNITPVKASVLGFGYSYAFMSFILIFVTVSFLFCHVIPCSLMQAAFSACAMFSLVHCLMLLSILSFGLCLVVLLCHWMLSCLSLWSCILSPLVCHVCLLSIKVCYAVPGHCLKSSLELMFVLFHVLDFFQVRWPQYFLNSNKKNNNFVNQSNLFFMQNQNTMHIPAQITAIWISLTNLCDLAIGRK